MHMYNYDIGYIILIHLYAWWASFPSTKVDNMLSIND